MPAIRVHHTETYDDPWDAGTQEKRLNCESEQCFDGMYAWRNPDADPLTKAAYSFPHHTVSDSGKPGAANLTACSAGIGALHGSRGNMPNIPDGDRRGVYDHLAAHLRDAGQTPPAFDEDGPDTAAAGAAGFTTITLPDLAPREWFDEPPIEPEYQLIVTDEGRLMGYLAPAGIPHRAPAYRSPGRRRTVRMDNVDYMKWLKTRGALTDKGWVTAGPMVMGCNHAPVTGYGTLQNRLELYENTCSIVGKLNIGRNDHGLWVAGALERDVTPGQLSRIFVSRLSGDWQPHQERPGWKEMIAALVVPSPGYTADSIDVASVSVDDEDVIVASAVPIVRMARPEPIVTASVGREVIELVASTMGVDTASQLAGFRQMFGR